MPTAPNTKEGIQTQLDTWKRSMSPKDYSRSKKVNKLVNILKSMDPGKFDIEAGGGLQAQLQRGIEDPTPEEIAGMGTSGQSGLGFSSGLGVPGASGEVNLQQIYDDAINTPEIQGLQSELTTKKDALTVALTGINDNPFYSEATRTGKIAKLEEQAQREIGDIEDQLNMRKADAQLRVNIATQQYNIDDNNYKNNLSKLNLLISSGALLNASSADIGQIALATGISTNMVVGMQNQMRASQIQPQVIANTDNAGNVTVSVIDSATGEIISQNSLGNVGKASAPSGTKDYKQGGELYNNAVVATTVDLNSVKGQDGYVSPVDFRSLRSIWVSLGLDGSSFDNQFSGFINPTHAGQYSVEYSGSGQSGTTINVRGGE